MSSPASRWPPSRSRRRWATPRSPRRRSSPACTRSSSPPSCSRCWARRGCWWSVPTRRPRRSWPPAWPGSGSPACRRTRPSGWPGPAWSRWSAAACWSSRACSSSASSATSSAPRCSIGFLTGVGIQVLAGQIPDMLGIPKGTGNWFEQQWCDDHPPRRRQRLDGRLRRRDPGHHPGVQAVPAGGAGRGRRGHPVDHPVGRP